MSDTREHAHIPVLKKQLCEGKIDRREFVRYSTLLGLSATAAYAFAGKVTGESFVQPARAQSMPMGGNIRIAMRVVEVTNPHAFSWVYDSNVTRQVAEYLTITGYDNVTRPSLLEGWEASDDLKTWTLKVRPGVNWHSGRPFVAQDVVANIEHMLNPESGSSVIGLMKGYMLNDEGTEIWDANAIEVVDDATVRLNLKVPQVAIPEHLFHYPAGMLDPDEGFVFGIGSNGTGAFDLVEHEVGVKSVLKARKDYWGDGPYIDTLTYIDLGDDPSAVIGAVASKQVDGIYEGDISQLDIFKAIPNVDLYSANTAQTAVARVQVDRPEFSDPRVR
ncbi:MAG TPA: ABC transporter substrate-binding protein, partial [Kiloniellaceae bacterium]|nr:ABC transporter substrate-binding protein [Kiloniellaceae bacterium]